MWIECESVDFKHYVAFWRSKGVGQHHCEIHMDDFLTHSLEFMPLWEDRSLTLLAEANAWCRKREYCPASLKGQVCTSQEVMARSYPTEERITLI